MQGTNYEDVRSYIHKMAPVPPRSSYTQDVELRMARLNEAQQVSLKPQSYCTASLGLY